LRQLEEPDLAGEIQQVEPQLPARRVKTPTYLQMEAVECGAAALGGVLAYHGRWVAPEQLREDCGISRDGSKAVNLIDAGKGYGLDAKGFRKDIAGLAELPLPFIVFWNFNHFVVVEGFGPDIVYLMDPGSGQRTVTMEEFSRSYTGISLTFEPGPEFQKGGQPPSLVRSLRSRLVGSEKGVLFAILIGAILVVPTLAVPTVTQVFVDQVLIRHLVNKVPSLLFILGFAIGAIALLTWWQQRVLFRVWQRLALTSSSEFFWHVLHLPVQFFNLRFAGDIAGRVALNEQVAQLLAGSLATNAVNALVIVLYAVIMIQYDIVLTVIGVAMALLNVVALHWVSGRRQAGNRLLQQQESRVISTSLSGLQMVETLKASGTEPDFFSRWSGYHMRASNTRQRLGVYNQFLLALPPLIASLTTVVVLGVGGLRVIEGVLTIGTLVAFQALMSTFSQPINGLVSFGGSIQAADGQLRQLDDVLNYKRDPAIDEHPPLDDSWMDQARLEGYLELRNVTFGYSKLDPPIIKDFSLHVRPGQRVALVGGSGSGKSTIAKLVTGLYAPWSGEILFDGKPHTGYPRAVMGNSLAAVDQDIFLFSGTIRENLTLWDANISEPDVIAAARDARIHDVASGRKGGYDSQIEEGGRNFSGGQRQRLEIARALVRDPSILVLDEATSALDPVTEKEIDESLRRRGCTCVIVAHRLSTIRDCDEIIVLDRGKVAQRGTHDELKAVDGLYATLIAAE
jgi:NHLM bacteriocin system ABC transporter peptidase/ATP-binding protein